MKERSEGSVSRGNGVTLEPGIPSASNGALLYFCWFYSLPERKAKGEQSGGKANRTIGEKRKPHVRCIIKLLYFQNALCIHGDLKFPLISPTPQHRQASDFLVCFCRHKLYTALLPKETPRESPDTGLSLGFSFTVIKLGKTVTPRLHFPVSKLRPTVMLS